MDPDVILIESLVVGGVSAALYGMFILLCCASLYFLIQRSNRKSRPARLMLSLVLLALFASTTVFTVVNQLYCKQIILLAFGSLSTQMTELQMSNCASTAAFTINVILGDAIVCWRAYVVWQGNKFVLGTCATLLLVTLATGTVDTKYDCTSSISMAGGSNSWRPDPHATGYGNLYQGFSYGVATTVLSLCTNLYATAAVALKAWRSWRILKRYIVTGRMVSQTGKVLSLLVESGAIYCAIWVVVVAYQVGIYTRNPYNLPCLSDTNCANKYYRSFWYIFALIVNGGQVHLIAMYPTIIIILVTLNCSHMENGFTKADDSRVHAALPLSPLAVAVDTAVSTRCDMEPRRKSNSVLVIGEQGLGSGEGLEGSSIHTREERKPDVII